MSEGELGPGGAGGAGEGGDSTFLGYSGMDKSAMEMPGASFQGVAGGRGAKGRSPGGKGRGARGAGGGPDDAYVPYSSPGESEGGSDSGGFDSSAATDNSGDASSWRGSGGSGGSQGPETLVSDPSAPRAPSRGGGAGAGGGEGGMIEETTGASSQGRGRAGAGRSVRAGRTGNSAGRGASGPEPAISKGTKGARAARSAGTAGASRKRASETRGSARRGAASGAEGDPPASRGISPPGGRRPGGGNLTTVSMYALAKGSTVDAPVYRFTNSYEVHLRQEDFATLDTLKGAVQGVFGSRYLRTQFFRMAFKEEFNETGFLTTDRKVQAALERRGPPPWDLAIVRYNRPQAEQLRPRVTRAEAAHLALILSTKRAYSRRDSEGPGRAAPVRRRPRAAAGADAGSGGESSAFPGAAGSQSDEEGSEGGPHPQAPSQAGVLATAGPGGDIPEPVSPLFSKDFFFQSEDEDGLKQSLARDSSLRDPEIVIGRILKHCPAAEAFSHAALNYWARLIIGRKHRSYVCPPPSFPLPDAFSLGGYRGVSVPSQIYAVCLVYAGYLERRHRELAEDE